MVGCSLYTICSLSGCLTKMFTSEKPVYIYCYGLCFVSLFFLNNAAFDTVDHNILLERLENWVGLSGMALKWFRSYLEGRVYYMSIGEHKSKWMSITCGVPQGSILAPLLFSLYMLPLSQIMRKNQIAYHSYADDTQIYLALSPNDYSPIDSLCQCLPCLDFSQ